MSSKKTPGLFADIERGEEVAPAEFDARELVLRPELLEAQFALEGSGRAVVVLIDGPDRWGTSRVANRLNEWLDVRRVATHAFVRETGQALRRPEQWRYWHALPARGRTALLLRGWTWRAACAVGWGALDDAGFERALDRHRVLERGLVAEGYHVVRLWIHLPRKVFKQRMRDDPAPDWMEARDRELLERWKPVLGAAARALTADGASDWTLIDGSDARHRDLAAGERVLAGLRAALAAHERPADAPQPVEVAARGGDAAPASVLDEVDLGAALERDAYERALDDLQDRLRRLAFEALEREVSTVLVFEGWDAAGKGGAIRRVTRALDAAFVQVARVAAPTPEERAHPWLWRFWTRVPRSGRVAIFDRSWYGRVLVERVEGFAREDDWRRAYGEIVDFEEQLQEHGIALAKFWLHIDPEEQLRRFRAREQVGHKRYKITEDDYRNREKWPAYVEAVEELLERTSTPSAPWHVLPATDKKYARVEVLRAVCDVLEQRLEADD